MLLMHSYWCGDHLLVTASTSVKVLVLYTLVHRSGSSFDLGTSRRPALPCLSKKKTTTFTSIFSKAYNERATKSEVFEPKERAAGWSRKALRREGYST